MILHKNTLMINEMEKCNLFEMSKWAILWKAPAVNHGQIDSSFFLKLDRKLNSSLVVSSKNYFGVAPEDFLIQPCMI